MVRNTLAKQQILYDDIDRPSKWIYIEKLVEYQEKLSLHLANKLTRKHLMWDRNIMNVKIAVQTLSESTATALQHLLNEAHPDFIGAEGTMNFILNINNIFDTLNSRSMFGYCYKKPINNVTSNH